VVRPIDDRYFEWLYGQVAAVRNRNPARSYWALCRQLYAREFVWFVPNDDNRVEDGKELRIEFMNEQDPGPADPAWMELGCSMLEMLIGLARRAAFQDGDNTIEWFWRFVDNIGLTDYTDEVMERDRGTQIDVEVALEQVIFRTYAPNGVGGLFPLQHAREDQRGVELIYQLYAYINEVMGL
jgi:hypothetical protein